VLPAGHRLRRRREFAAAVRRGRRAGRLLLVVHMYVADGPVEDLAVARIGLVVARTVGSAVVRNRVKRRLRHLLRERVNGLPAGALLVVRALPGAATAGSTQLAAELDGALERVQRLRATPAAVHPRAAEEGAS
jgi:ribonuclease P protein component